MNFATRSRSPPDPEIPHAPPQGETLPNLTNLTCGRLVSLPQGYMYTTKTDSTCSGKEVPNVGKDGNPRVYRVEKPIYAALLKVVEDYGSVPFPLGYWMMASTRRRRLMRFLYLRDS